MKILAVFLFICASSLLSAYDNFSLNKNECLKKSEIRNELISTNVNYVKNSICKKIQEAELKLEKYKDNLNNSQSGSEVQLWLKKIQKTENKVKHLNDVLLGLGIAESKFPQ